MTHVIPPSNTTADARQKWPELLVQMLDCAQRTGQRLGLDESDAERFAYEFIRDQAREIGGCQVYIPKGDALDRALRDREIYQQAGRVAVETLAQRHNLSMKQVWEIQRRQRELHIRTVQVPLF